MFLVSRSVTNNGHNDLAESMEHGKVDRPLQRRTEITRELILEVSATLFG